MGRRGLRPTWVEDPATREPVVGLVCRSDGRHAANANPNKTFGKDRRDAIRRFYAWQSRQQGQTVTVRETGPLSDIVRADWEDWREHHPDADARQYYAEGLATNESIKFKRIQEAAFWEIVATVICDNPKLAARKTGIEELAYLADPAPRQPSVSLIAIGERFFVDKSRMSGDEQTSSRTWWGEFMRFTGSKTVAHLSHDAVRKYREKVKANQRIPITRNGKTRPKSNAYTRSRFSKIGTIINHALREIDLSPRDREKLALKLLLKKPPKPKSNPVDISLEELTAILDHAGDFDTALILTALNCNFYPIDCARLQWSMMDLDKGTLCFDREKPEHLTDSAIVRVAVLWKRTIEAMRKIRNDDTYVFPIAGRMMEPQMPNARFKRLLKRAGVKRNLTFCHLRDSGQTRAAEAGVPMQEYRVLARHKIGGVDDDYIRRKPMFVKTACKAIEDYYFRGKK